MHRTFVGRLLFVAMCFLVLSSSVNAAGLFSFTMPWNDASDNALNLQAWQSSRAGANGFVFVDGAGHLATSLGRQRFWGTNSVFGASFPQYSDAEQVAGRLAKFGFNIVRFHHMDSTLATNGIWDSVAPDRNLDAGQLDKMDYLINQLAAKGIYSNLNLVVSRPFHPGAELNPQILNITDVKVRAALGFFDPANLALQKNYATALLNHVNPYTGHAYKNEPAIAFVEVNNENGLVQAWMSQQLDKLPPYYTSLLNQQWNQWLVLKYGTQPLMTSAWRVSNSPLGGELLANGSFTSTLGSWVVEQHAPTVVTGAVTADGAGGTNVARIDVTTAGTVAWGAQFNQGNLSVTAGSPYTLSFWAKADASKAIEVDLGQNHSPYSTLGLSAILNLTTTWQFFQFTFVPNATDSNARINFGGMGMLVGQFYFGNVTLKPGGTVGIYPGEDLNTSSIRNFLNVGETIGRTTEARKDWLRFLLNTEQKYWTAMRDHIRTTIGSQSLIMGTAQGSSTPNLQAGFDVIDTHYYWRHPSFPGMPWDPINWYIGNDAMVDDPANASMSAMGMQSVLGKPVSCTELNAPFPNGYEADIFLLTAAYAGLQDFDAIYPFAYWSSNTNWAYTGVNNYFEVAGNPLKMAGMPAASLAFRRGDFSPANQLVAVPLVREDEVTQLLTSGAWRLVNANTAGEDPRTALIHRVRQVVEGQSVPGGSLGVATTAVAGAHLDSDTGQLHWDKSQSTNGLVYGDSPRSQFVAGFFNGRSVSLSNLSITAVASQQNGNYAVISLSSLDNLDLSRTASALLTVLGSQRNTGSTYFQYPNTPTSYPPAKGTQVTLRDQWGSGPALVEGVSATVTLSYAATDVQVWALTSTGARGLSVPVLNVGGNAQIVVSAAYQALNYEIAVNRPAYSPTVTCTVTPVQSPTVTRTVSPTPTPAASINWQDWESAVAPSAWQSYIDTSSGSILSSGLVTSTAVVGEGYYSGEVRFNSGTSGNWGGGLLLDSYYGTKPALGWRELSGMNFLQIMLWTDKAGLRVRPTLSEAGNTSTAINGADGEIWESNNGNWTVLPANAWVTLNYPLSAFRDKPNYPYSPTSLGNNTLDLGAIAWVTLEWDGNQGSNITLRTDLAKFYNAMPTATMTPGPSATVTATALATLPVASTTRTAVTDPGGPLRVLKSFPVPHPQGGPDVVLGVDLLGGAESLRVHIYDSAYTQVFQGDAPGPWGIGWNSVRFENVPAANGILYYVLEARRGTESVHASPQRLVRLQ